MRAAALALVVAACGSGGGFPDAARLPPDAPLPGVAIAPGQTATVMPIVFVVPGA